MLIDPKCYIFKKDNATFLSVRGTSIHSMGTMDVAFDNGCTLSVVVPESGV